MIQAFTIFLFFFLVASLLAFVVAGQGSTFWFSLPCHTPSHGIAAEAGNQKKEPAVVPHPGYDWSGKKILVLEDEETSCWKSSPFTLEINKFVIRHSSIVIIKTSMNPQTSKSCQSNARRR